MIGPDDRDELLARMAALLERWGWRRWIAAPILEPSDRHFPDPYTPDLAGVRTVARRLLAHAGLEQLAVDAVGVEQADHDPLAQTLATLTDVDEREVGFAIYGIGPAEDVPLVLAHEVARAYHQLRAGALVGDHPYRAPAFDDPDACVDEDVEEEVSLTACYLGFGLLVAMGAHRYKATGEFTGYVAITRWVHQCLGALAPDEACFLLAAHAVARGVDDETIARWRNHLGVNERKPFGRFVEELRADRAALLTSLGLPDEAEWPEPVDAPPTPLPDDGWSPLDPDEELEDAPDEPVFRRFEHRAWSFAGAAGVLGFVAFIAVLFEDSRVASWVLIGSPVAAVVAFFVGKRVRAVDTCSICEASLAADAERCGGCGGVIRGELAAHESHLDGLERLTDVTTFGGTIASADQEDAAARYVEAGVKCPSCGWIPDGEAHWGCDACEGDDFNTFAHGGECPHCAQVFDETLCPRCETLSAYDWWWPADDHGV